MSKQNIETTMPDQNIPEESGHYQYKLKCLSCYLHFIILSWNPNWSEKRKVYCPECGQNNVLIFGKVKVQKAIFEEVPGDLL